MNIIDKINEKQINPNIPEFRVGDTVRVDVKIIEGKRERIQAFEGVVVARRGSSVSETFTVRKISSGVGVERTFPIHSPKVAGITVVRKGKVRRAKLRFLRGMVGGYHAPDRFDMFRLFRVLLSLLTQTVYMYRKCLRLRKAVRPPDRIEKVLL